MHTLEPAKLNVPGGHTASVLFVEPDGHTYPAVHAPEHVATAWPPTAPNDPAAHKPSQLAFVAPGVEP